MFLFRVNFKFFSVIYFKMSKTCQQIIDNLSVKSTFMIQVGQRKTHARETHMVNTLQSVREGKGKTLRELWSKEHRTFPCKETLPFSLPSLALCGLPQSQALPPALLGKQSWLSLDIWQGSDCCCFSQIGHSRNPSPRLVGLFGGRREEKGHRGSFWSPCAGAAGSL